MFNFLIEGVKITPTTKKNCWGLASGLNVIEWLKLNNDDFRKAAIFFDYHEGSLRKKVRKLGYKPHARDLITKEILERAILDHITFGSINEISAKEGFHRQALATGMRRLGYSLNQRCYINKPDSIKKISYQDILYNPILSYVGTN